MPLVAKVGNHVMPWRDRYNTNAGKVCLTNACLSPLPMLTMGFYRLIEGTHAGFDKHRGAFYWNSADNRRKYRLVKWKFIYTPKTHGGLGIVNTSIMNKRLIITKWWKILSSGPDCLWYTLV